MAGDQPVVRFYELVAERSRGLVGGLTFSAETTSLKGKRRSGTVEERSSYLGRRYDYTLEWGAVRGLVEQAAARHGYGVEVVLRERSL